MRRLQLLPVATQAAGQDAPMTSTSDFATKLMVVTTRVAQATEPEEIRRAMVQYYKVFNSLAAFVEKHARERIGEIHKEEKERLDRAIRKALKTMDKTVDGFEEKARRMAQDAIKKTAETAEAQVGDFGRQAARDEVAKQLKDTRQETKEFLETVKRESREQSEQIRRELQQGLNAGVQNVNAILEQTIREMREEVASAVQDLKDQNAVPTEYIE